MPEYTCGILTNSATNDARSRIRENSGLRQGQLSSLLQRNSHEFRYG